VSMSFKRVDPASVASYAPKANEHIGNVYARLQELINAVVEVQYFGPNAFDFKIKAGTMTETFAEAFMKDFINFAQSIATATSNIAGALGSGKITVTVDPKKLDPPTPSSVEYVEVDTSKLSELAATTVPGRIDALTAELEAHVGTVKGLDWVSNTQEATVAGVVKWTSAASEKARAFQQGLAKFISEQIDAVNKADTVA
jgi:hypothetical protein